MSMADPQHTLFTFDMRPFKAAALHTINECAEGRLGPFKAAERIEALALSVPYLDAKDYANQMLRVLPTGHARAARLVNCFDDFTLQAWVRPAARLIWRATKLGALAAFVWFIVQLAK